MVGTLRFAHPTNLLRRTAISGCSITARPLYAGMRADVFPPNKKYTGGNHDNLTALSQFPTRAPRLRPPQDADRRGRACGFGRDNENGFCRFRRAARPDPRANDGIAAPPGRPPRPPRPANPALAPRAARPAPRRPLPASRLESMKKPKVSFGPTG